MITLEQFLNIARNEIGYQEGKNNDTKYGKWYGLNNNPWCAMFISWCANQVGILNNKIPKYSGCGTGYNWFKNKNLITKTPQAGYIGFLKPTSSGAVSSHTFIVESVDTNEIHTIEGNLDNSVKRNIRKINDNNILGFGIVEFENTSTSGVIKYIDNVDYEGLNVRRISDHKIMRVIPLGEKITIIKTSGNKALLNDNEFVYSAYLSDKKPSLKSVTGADSEGLNVRNRPSIKGVKITTLKNGTKVKIYSIKNGWARISPDSNAWVSANYLK